MQHLRSGQRRRQGPKERGVCWYWARGKCVRGAACRFIHDVAGEPDEAASPAEEEQEEVLEARAFRHSDLATLNRLDLGADPAAASTVPEGTEPNADAVPGG